MSAPRAPRAPSATIVAFDGAIADTLGLRARALVDAFAEMTRRLGLHSIALTVDAQALVPGRTFGEAAREMLPMVVGSLGDLVPPLETLADLVAVDAGRRYGQALSNGISLCPDAQSLLSGLALEGRVIARADSARRDVDAILSLAGLDGAFAFVRCSDDAPREIGVSSVRGSWIAIDRRLLSSGVAIENRTALEVAEHGVDAARPFVARVQRSRFRP